MSGAADWTRVPVTRLRFPPACCRCGCETQDTRTFYGGRPWYYVVLERIIGLETTLEVPVPYCADCARGDRRAWSRGILMGLAASLAVLLIGGAVVGSLRLNSPTITVVLGLIVSSCPVVGYFAARRSDAVSLRNYRSGDGTVELCFRNPQYAARVLKEWQQP